MDGCVGGCWWWEYYMGEENKPCELSSDKDF